MSRPTSSHTVGLEAECLRCAWKTSALNGLGNAARHHDASGHAVTVTIARTVTYGDPSAPMEGQTALDLDGDVAQAA